MVIVKVLELVRSFARISPFFPLRASPEKLHKSYSNICNFKLVTLIYRSRE